MTSSFQQTGLALQVYDPLVLGGRFLFDITNQIDDYSHEKGADDYYLNASFSLFLQELDLQDWFLNGLGRHVVILSPDLTTVWEGFVNSLTITVGANTYVLGPLMEIGNRVYTVYTPFYIADSTQAGVRGTTSETTLVNDTTSQALFGIIEKALSAGECLVTPTTNEADWLRDVFLQEKAYPNRSNDFTFSATEEPRITVECVGYWRWLDAYVWNNRLTPAAYGWATTDSKLKTILTANPNSFALSSDQTQIAANTAICQLFEKDNKTALTIIKALTAAGDPSGNRWLFGVGKDRKAYFRQATTTPIYDYKIKDNQQILTLKGTDVLVRPWDIEPGNWYTSVDWFIGRSYPTIYQNPLSTFIESVRYTAPFSFELIEGKLNTLAQILAYKGLGSI